MILVRELERFAREELDARGYQEISTPLLVNKRCGSSPGTGTSTATTCSRSRSRSEIFSLKPMNCPESTYVYRRALRSYRDLPIRCSRDGPLPPQRAVGHAHRASCACASSPRTTPTSTAGPISSRRRSRRCSGWSASGTPPSSSSRASSCPRGPEKSLGTQEQWDAGGGRAPPGPGRQRPRLRAESRATAPSTAPRSTSTSRTRWAARGRSPPSRWI